MSKNTAKSNNRKHLLLHHPVNLSHAMHVLTGVTSLYLFGIFFALIGFVSGYAAGLTSNVAKPSQDTQKMTQAEDLDIFVQDIFNDPALDELDSNVKGVATQSDEAEMEIFNPIDGEVINTPPLEIQVSEPTGMTQEDSVLSSAPVIQSSNNTSSSMPDDIATYGLIISMGGMVFGMNLMYEEDYKANLREKRLKK